MLDGMVGSGEEEGRAMRDVSAAGSWLLGGCAATALHLLKLSASLLAPCTLPLPLPSHVPGRAGSNAGAVRVSTACSALACSPVPNNLTMLSRRATFD